MLPAPLQMARDTVDGALAALPERQGVLDAVFGAPEPVFAGGAGASGRGDQPGRAHALRAASVAHAAAPGQVAARRHCRRVQE